MCVLSVSIMFLVSVSRKCSTSCLFLSDNKSIFVSTLTACVSIATIAESAVSAPAMNLNKNFKKSKRFSYFSDSKTK